MNDRIEVLVDLSIGIAKMKSTISELDLFEKKSDELKKLLEDVSKWSGETQKECTQIHKLIDEYEQALRPICEQYYKELDALMESAEFFDGNSACVTALKGI